MIEDRYGGQTPYQEGSSFGDFGKIFVHGLLYSLIMSFVLSYLLTIVLVLMLFLDIFGIVIGFAAFFLAIGGLNHGIAGWLWRIESKGALTSLIGQGVVLGVPLFALQYLFLFLGIIFLFGPIATYFIYSVVQFIVLAFIYGALGRQVAIWFRQDPVSWPRRSTTTPWTTSPAPASPSSGGVPTYCPNCKAAFPVSQSTHSEEIPKCRICGTEINTGRQDAFADPVPTPGTIPCPFCNTEYSNIDINMEGFIVCKNCGSTFRASRSGREPQPPKRTDTKDWDW